MKKFKAKVCTFIFVIMIILNSILLIIENFTILTTDYVMLCSKTDREYIQSISHTNYNFKIAMVDVKGFMNTYSDAEIVINNVLLYPTTLGERKVIENNPENIKNNISLYIEEHSNRILVWVVCVAPYIIFYLLITLIYVKIYKKRRTNK